MTATVRVLVIAEGSSEIGDLDALAGGGGSNRSRHCDGYIPPMIRKLLGVAVQVEAQRITAIGRFEKKRRLGGHADRAAKALVLAATNGYDILVFVKDVDKQSGTKKSNAERAKVMQVMRAQIESGFAAVDDASSVSRVKATPCRMLEAWVLGDCEAITKVASVRPGRTSVPARPEELWGDKRNPSSNHPKRVLQRAMGGQAPNARIFEQLAGAANPATLRRTCPDSFAPFADEVHAALAAIRSKL